MAFLKTVKKAHGRPLPLRDREGIVRGREGGGCRSVKRMDESTNRMPQLFLTGALILLNMGLTT